MLGVDTNVLVRLLIEDYPAQTRRARKPGIRTMAVAVLAIAVFATWGAFASASTRVEFFYMEVRQPLTTANEILQLARACQVQFAKRCRLPSDLDGPALSRISQLFDALPNANLATEVLPALRSPEQAKRDVVRLNQRLSDDLPDREMILLRKVAAVVNECERQDDSKQQVFSSLERVRELNFRRFWKQSDHEYAQTSAHDWAETLEYRRQIQNTWTDEDCSLNYRAARGIYDVFVAKVEAYSGDDWLQIPMSKRAGDAASFTWQLGRTLEVALDPRVDERIDEIEKSRAPEDARRHP